MDIKHIQALSVFGAVLSLNLNPNEVTGDPAVDFENEYLAKMKAGVVVKLTPDGLDLAVDGSEAIGILNSSVLQNAGGIQYALASGKADVITGGSLVRVTIEGTPAIGAKVYVKDGVLQLDENGTSVGVVVEAYANNYCDVLLSI